MPTTHTKLPYQFISIKGEDAEKFLQGQTSCDVSSLEIGKASYGTVNTPKGRMYGLFLLIRIENGFLLRLHESTSELFISTLSKYKVFFKCELKIEANLNAFGLESNPVEGEELAPLTVTTNNDAWIIRLPGAHSLYERWSSEELDGQATEPEAWHCLACQNGLPELYQNTQDQFILQYLNLQNLNAVSFNKGCYTGQEIIARMKFLGKLKKKTFLLNSEAQETAPAGSAIFDDTGKKCGELVRSHWHADHGSVALGILDLSYAEDPKPVFLTENRDTPFSVQALVYK